MVAPRNDPIDSLVLSFAKPRWQKLAMLIYRVASHNGNLSSEAELDSIAMRIEKLVELGKLEAQGNLRRWRHSEVRLPLRRGSPSASTRS